MSMKTASFSLLYSVFQILEGQLTHPYKTMRELVRDKVFMWMSASPIFLWFFCLIIWRIISYALFTIIPYPSFWVFLALWFTTATAMYQMLLIYLFVRFSLAKI